MVMNLALILFGPLAEPECRRALARGWLIAVRTLAAMVLAAVAISVIWYWWLGVRLDPFYLPSSELRYALAAGGMIELTIAVVMPPALLAGSLAGERERGVLQLLLTAAVSAREVVVGRMAGKLSQVWMILLAGLGPLALLAAWSGLSLLQFAILLLLVLAVAVGSGGMGVIASVLSRRGRDALLSVYMVILLFLLTPLATNLGLPHEVGDWLAELSPYPAMAHLTLIGATPPALVTSACWFGVGILGTALACWRLRPSCLSVGVVVQRAKWRGKVPPVGERPMLWKELYIERAGTLGRFGRWLGVLITVPIVGASVGLAAAFMWSLFWRGDTEWANWATSYLSFLLDGTGTPLGWLLQWAIGLRAAVAIAAERERGTWDGLLVSPLEPGEIVPAKLVSSLHALRWLIGTMLLAWTLGLLMGAASAGKYAQWVIGNISAGLFMAAIGLRCSVSLPTATRAMTWTIASWLISCALLPILALSLISIAMLLMAAFWMVSLQYGLVPGSSPPSFPVGFPTTWAIAMNSVTLLSAFLIALETRLRFDWLAGRQASSAIANLFARDREARRPVLLEGKA
jgi:ABC-type transport system involved in multi-copper enzyme maturation permease subunit